LLICRN